VLRVIAIGLVYLLSASWSVAGEAPSAQAAVRRALPLLQRSAATFVAQRACVSCHHNSLAILTLRAAQQHGVIVDAKTLDAVETKTFRQLRGATALDDAVQGLVVSDPTPNESLLLMAAHEAGVAPDLTTAVMARRMARRQHDSHWTTSDFRPPHSSSDFTATATAIRAIRAYVPPELASERDAAIARARDWLIATRGASIEDAAFRVMGLTWADASAAEFAPAVRDLQSRQQPDGGWAQLPGYPSDAYSTGESLYALREAGVSVDDAAWRKGIRFLLSTQAADGTWRVRTRMVSPAKVSPPYFSTGFPYAKDSFLSYAGSSWAVMALLSSLPDGPAEAGHYGETAEGPAKGGRNGETAEGSPEAGHDGETSSAAWARTALFGTASELAALLDAGLDPNSRTAKGTSLLMMAAADADKVRLLLARGANASQRAESGVDALTVASSYRGTAASMRLLVDAGAKPQPPDDVRVRRKPLVFAAMTGDMDVMRLLLSRGAQPDAEALSEAITFDHPESAQALIDAGADANITEGSGINLLHWAAMTNRPAMIPILAKAGVPVDAIDDAGYTPLMYAATVDVGGTETLKALLTAGANRSIRNARGRTPIQQARFYRHAAIVDALN
jgi:ankyrin repeat protein